MEEKVPGGLDFDIQNEFDVKIAVVNTGKFVLKKTNNQVFAQSLSTTVSELGQNILKYASSGDISVYYIEKANGKYFEVIAKDRGPGIANVSKALEDNYSTSGTLGLGLSGINRLVDELIIDSNVGIGTCIKAKKIFSA